MRDYANIISLSPETFPEGVQGSSSSCDKQPACCPARCPPRPDPDKPKKSLIYNAHDTQRTFKNYSAILKTSRGYGKLRLGMSSPVKTQTS